MHPEELVDKYDETRREVRHLHMDIYYRPMLPINAGLDDEQVELSANAMQERFASDSPTPTPPCATSPH